MNLLSPTSTQLLAFGAIVASTDALFLSLSSSPLGNVVFPTAGIPSIGGCHDVNPSAVDDPVKSVPHRRNFLRKISWAIAIGGTSAALSSAPGAANADAESMERGGVKLTPFNSLTFNYRGGSSPTIPDTLNEPSISYSDFLSRLDSDQVSYVEFLAPNGNVAYASFKLTSSGGEPAVPMRIGEGYPLEDPEGWSSPAFVIKAVAKKGVPYKFVVPGMNTP